uniref:SAC3/GANP/THP3 conserved domain-containing protein n=1 Tax=Meloidogyne javanica TaxID=6303 RepID=A0A915MCR2_MELJA
MDSNEIMQRRQKRLASAESSNNLPKINLNLSKEEMCIRDEFLSKLVNLDSKPGNNKFIKGTCQDMCPEKERYMRDVKKSLHFYECDSEGRIVHEKMVKDYSRSAADQDITQQMLQSEMAVDLVEKCARLHIFSAFKLISLGTEHVNQEINSEMSSLNAASDHPAMAIAAYNTCSHTLRQMYDDLAKMQRSCLNEPEFRSYDIILNLTDFNVYSQVLSYRQSVRESKEVQLALNLASALQNNNYILFFRLVKNHATFLQACLCYQFFASIRSSGLKVICMAFNSFPLEKFIESLAFDSTEQALSFMKVFGVELDRVDPNLINTRDGKNIFLQSNEMPKPNLIPQMGCKWIEEKSIHLTVPQIFCNCQTPITPPKTTLRHVNNSFSTSNVYENDPILNAVLREHKVAVNSVNKKTLPMNFSFARGIQPFKTSKQNYPFSAIQADHIIAKHWINFTKIRKREKMTKNLVINIANSTLSFIVNSNLERLSAGMLRLANEIATIQGDLLLEKVLSEQLSSIVTRVRASQVRDIEDRLKQIGQNLHLIWQRQFTNHWLAKTRRNRLIRSITFLSTEEELNITNENGFTIVNGFSPAESNGKRATAVSIRDEILNENGTQGGGFFAESTSKLNLFKPGMTKNAENSQKLVEEMLKKKRRIDDGRRETNDGDDFDNVDVIIDFQSFPTTSELKRRRLI